LVTDDQFQFVSQLMQFMAFKDDIHGNQVSHLNSISAWFHVPQPYYFASPWFYVINYSLAQLVMQLS